MKLLTNTLICLAILFAGLFCVTQSMIPQVVPLLLVSLALVITLFNYKEWEIKGNRISMLLAIAMMSYLIIRAITSPVKEMAELDLALILCSGAVFFIYVAWLNDIKCYFFPISIFALLAVLNMLNFIPIIGDWRDSVIPYAKGTEVTGLYNHRNFFSNFMAMFSLLCIAFTLFSKYKISFKIISAVLFSITIATLVMAESRGAFLGLIGGLISLGMIFLTNGFFKKLHRDGKSKTLSCYVILMITIIAAIGIGANHILESRGDVVDGEMKMADGGRSLFHIMAVDQWVDAPLFGNGARSYQYLTHQNWDIQLSDAENHLHVHNEFIQLLSEYGMVGLALVLTFLIYTIFSTISKLYGSRHEALKDNRNSSEWLEIAVLTIIVMMALHSLFSFPIHSLSNLMIFTVLISWLHSSKKLSNRQHEGKEKMGLIKPCLAMVMVVNIIVITIIGSIEVPASIAFWKNGIGADDLNWAPHEVENIDEWEKALDTACRVAPSANRLNRLGNIYLFKLNSITNSEEYEATLNEALAVFVKSKKIHPYDPISRLNIAEIFYLQKKYDEAIKEYLDAEKYTKNREKLYNFYLRLGYVYEAKAISSFGKVPIGKVAELHQLALKNLNISREKTFHLGKRQWIELSYTIHLNYSRILRAQRKFDLANKNFDIYYEEMNAFLWRIRDQKRMQRHANEIITESLLAKDIYDLKRQFQLLQKAQAAFLGVKSFAEGKTNSAWAKEYEYVNKELKFLRKRGFK